MTITATNVDTLRQGWEDAVSTLAPGVDELPILLETRLAEAVRHRRLDEPALLAVVDEAWRVAAKRVAPEESSQLARRMQQAVYEYLLSLDAIVEPKMDPIAQDPPGAGANATLIGVEEVAELTAPEAAPAPEPAPAAPDEGSPAPPEVAEPEAPVAEQPVEEPAAVAPAEPLGGEPEAEQPVTEVLEADATPAEAPRRRFTLFRRSGASTSLDAEPSDSGPDQQAIAEPDVQQPAAELQPPGQAPASPPPFVAPKDGFHITEFSDVVAANPDGAPAGVAPAPPVIPRTAEPAPPANGNGGTRSWHIRNLRKRQRDQAIAPEDDATAEADEESDEVMPVAAESRFETDPEIVEARRQINDRLRHRRCDEAASLLQRLANEFGGREVAELALDAGDRCRALGKSNAALSCYLAASRADPVHETPLLRLADICLDDKDIDLAVSYLERVARLHRLRGDRKGSLRVYRKIATVAPYRDDILNLLMHVQATGRFEDE